MKILVTGGAGRLGQRVIKLLSEKGYSVVAFDLPQVNWDPLLSIENVETYQGDITSRDDASEAVKEVEGIIHLAAVLPPMSERDKELTERVNVEGTSNLIAASAENAKILLASSISVYGITEKESPPIKEDHPLAPHNNYSRSKIEAERIVKDSGNPYMILRIAPVSVVDLVELPNVVPYRSNQRVEFVLDEDAAVAIVNGIDWDKDEVFNIAGGKTWQMRGEHYIDRFYDALGVEVDPVYSENYTAVDWYDSSKSRVLSYQETSFMEFEGKLVALAEEMGLR
ncbi:NAD-dependent epimerase/dehydratase family protein [Candidatus Bathyarchaeota archaeon]|nr:NAD-dependent epimerase/dehydratase family protein [Candidatus Bathyarchaeota archaeon]